MFGVYSLHWRDLVGKRSEFRRYYAWRMEFSLRQAQACSATMGSQNGSNETMEDAYVTTLDNHDDFRLSIDNVASLRSDWGGSFAPE